MNHSSSNSSAINDSARCQHRTTSGKRCRLRVVDPRSGLCFRHSANRSELLHAADLRSILAGELTEFECAEDINKFLSNLLLLLAEDRVSTRRGAVMAYTCNLLLRTLSVRMQELKAGFDEEPRVIVDVGDLPRPDRSAIPAAPVTSEPSHVS